MTPKACLFLTSVLAIGLARASAPAAQQATFRSATDVVEIDAAVLRRNRPVDGLSAADFELLDDAVPQRLQVEVAATVPIDVSLLIDQSALAQMSFGARFKEDIGRMAGLLRPADRLGVIGFAREVSELMPLQGPTLWSPASVPDPTTLQAWEGHKGRPTQTELDLKFSPRWRLQSLGDAVLLALARRSETGRRHLVIVLTWAPVDDGSVTSLRVPLAPIAARSDALLEFAARHPSDPSFLGGPRGNTLQFSDRNIAEAAAATGGSVHNILDGIGAFKSILESFRQRYILRYTATGVDPGGWHEVTVRVPAHPEYEIRARRGYLGR